VDVFTVPFVPDKTVLQVLLDLFGERTARSPSGASAATGASAAPA
jgi:hypothetical protein